jgi:hypothetical protein
MHEDCQSNNSEMLSHISAGGYVTHLIFGSGFARRRTFSGDDVPLLLLAHLRVCPPQNRAGQTG